MKLTISRSDLSALIAKGGLTTPRAGNVIPILAHARLTAKAGTLRVTTTDLDMQAEAVGGAKIDAPGETTVNAAKLKAVVDKLPAGASIDLAIDGGDLVVKSGRSKVKLATLPATDFPNLDSVDGKNDAVFALPGSDLDRILARPMAVAKMIANPNATLHSVFMHYRPDGVQGDGPMLCGCGTNGHLLVLAGVGLPDGAASLPDNGVGIPGVVLSFEAVETILRLFKAEPSVRVSVSAQRIILEGETTRLLSKLVAGTYPEYTRLIGTPCDNLVTLDRAGCISTVALVETFTGKAQGHAVECAPAPGGIVIAAQSSGEEGATVADAEVTGTVEPFGLNAIYLRALLGSFKSETVTLSVPPAASGILAFTEFETDTVGLIMRMRVSTAFAARVAEAA